MKRKPRKKTASEALPPLTVATAWVSANTVWLEAGSPEISTLGFSSQTTLESHISTYILPAVQDNINEYLNQAYDDTSVPEGVKYAALRVAANALIKIAVRKMGPMVRISDYKVETAGAEIFTPEIQREIDCYMARAHSTAPVASSYKSHEMRERWGEDVEGEDEDT